MDIYKRKSYLKRILLLTALVIGAFTLYYTNQLVKKLEEREKKLIDLYAKGMQAIISSSESSDISFMFSEIIEANKSIPVILTDEKFVPIPNRYRNIEIPEDASEQEVADILSRELEIMKSQHEPIEVSHEDIFKNYVFYKNSHLLTRLKYFPYIQLVIGISFIAIAYMAFSYSRKSEQNMVWVGMAKETAHQLGTPLSSMMGWIDYFKTKENYKDDPAIKELQKDVEKLKIITERFSNIGSVPELEKIDFKAFVDEFVDYLRPRISRKIQLEAVGEHVEISINSALFGWALENLCKNAVDAMKGEGQLIIRYYKKDHKFYVDVEDTGMGLTSDQRKKVFNPGFTTKQRGWGLGLTLTKRIIEEYHKGKISVKSTSKEGTTFQIAL